MIIKPSHHHNLSSRTYKALYDLTWLNSPASSFIFPYSYLTFNLLNSLFPQKSRPTSPFSPLHIHTNYSFCLECSLLAAHPPFLPKSYLCFSSQPKCRFFQDTFSALLQLHEKRDHICLVPTNFQLLEENLKHGRTCLKLGLRYAGYRENIIQV